MIKEKDLNLITAFREGHVVGFQENDIIIRAHLGNMLVAPNRDNKFRLGQKVCFSRNYINKPAIVLSESEWITLVERFEHPHPINEIPEDIVELEEMEEAIINGEYDYAEFAEEDEEFLGL